MGPDWGWGIKLVTLRFVGWCPSNRSGQKIHILEGTIAYIISLFSKLIGSILFLQIQRLKNQYRRRKCNRILKTMGRLGLTNFMRKTFHFFKFCVFLFSI